MGNEQCIASILVLSVALYLHMKVLQFMSFEALKQRRKRCKEISANDRLEAGTILASILFLMMALIYQEAKNPIFAGFMIAILLGGCGLVLYYFIIAYLEQLKEENDMKKAGMHED